MDSTLNCSANVVTSRRFAVWGVTAVVVSRSCKLDLLNSGVDEVRGFQSIRLSSRRRRSFQPKVVLVRLLFMTSTIGVPFLTIVEGREIAKGYLFLHSA